jgi:hypothetical protein
MNPGRDEEIAASVGAHHDLGPAYDDAIAAGLVERIGAEVDRRVDERISRYQHGGRAAGGDAGNSAPAAGQPAQPAPHAQHPPAVHPGGQVSWQHAILAFGSMVIGAVTTGINAAHGNGTWPIIVIWIAIVVINMAIFRAFRRDRRSPD